MIMVDRHHGRPWSTMVNESHTSLTMVDHGRPWSHDHRHHSISRSTMNYHDRPPNAVVTVVDHGRPWSPFRLGCAAKCLNVPQAVSMCNRLSQCTADFSMCRRLSLCAAKFLNVPQTVSMCRRLSQCATDFLNVPQTVTV